MHDLVIRGGRVVDGSGAAEREADVAVDGDKIVEVGKVGPGRRELDAAGLLVTPGFVDVHTHYDAQVTWDPYLTPSGWHGCTTVVMGNCGVGFAPVKPDRHQWLIALMEGVEDIPGTAMTEGIKWQWESFPQYLDAISRQPHALDFGCQVPHGALRAYVMGERGARNEESTGLDRAAMRKLVREALEAGALGVSTSRTSLHKSMSGDPVPGTFAGREELFALGDGLADAGHGVFQLAAEHLEVPKELDWMRALTRRTGRPVSFNLNQTDWGPEVWKDVVRQLDDAAAAGEQVYAQVAGRSIGVLMGWQCTAHPFVGSATARDLATLPWPERLRRLRDPSVRRGILDEQPADLGPFGNVVTRAFDKMFASHGDIDYEPRLDDSIGARALSEGLSPRSLAYDALMKDEGRALIYLPLFNYAYGDLEMLRTLHLHPRTRMGLSDAGAHCGAICDGGMPTFMLTHWTRDRRRGEKLPLEHVIARQTRGTAELLGLTDRGLIAPGYKADLNIIDHAKLRFLQPEVAFDLPAQGRRLVQRASGYVATFVSGTAIVEHDTFTGAMPGKLVRGRKAT